MLGLTDTAAAVAKLPGVLAVESEAQAATGTFDTCGQIRPPIVPLLGRETERNGATEHVGAPHASTAPVDEKTRISAGQSDQMRDSARMERRRLEPLTPSLQS